MNGPAEFYNKALKSHWRVETNGTAGEKRTRRGWQGVKVGWQRSSDTEHNAQARSNDLACAQKESTGLKKREYEILLHPRTLSVENVSRKRDGVLDLLC